MLRSLIATSVFFCALLPARAPARQAPSTLVRPEVDPDDAPRADDPAQVRVITRDEILGRGPRRSLSLAAVLEGEPGTTVTSAGGPGQYSAVLLRGAAPAQVLVLLDGVPLNRGAQGAVDLSLLPVEGLERIEVYRGVPPLELGSDAIGGAIHLISRRGQKVPSLQLLPTAGSFGLRRVAASYAAAPVGGLRVAASILYQGAQGDFPHYHDSGLALGKEGHGEVLRRNNHFDQAAATVVLRKISGPLSLRLCAQGLLKLQGVPTIGQPGAASSDPDLSTGRGLLLLGLRRSFLDGRLELDLETHALLIGSRSRGASGDLGPTPRENRELLTPEVGGQISLRARRLGPLSLLLLLEARQEFARSSDLCPAPQRTCPAPLTQSERLRASAAIGGELRFFGDRLVLQPGMHVLLARSSLRPIAGTAPAERVEPIEDLTPFVSPRLLLRWRARSSQPSVLLRAGAGRFVRLPTFLEIFGDGGRFGPSLTLRPESAWTAEAGAGLSGRAGPLQLRAEAAGFTRLISDLIIVGANGDRLISQNIGEAHIFGAELELGAALGDLVALRATYTFLDARNRSSLPAYEGRLLPRRPQHSALVRADVGYRAWHAFYELAHASLAYQDEANHQPMPARTLHTLGLRLGPYGPARLALSVEVHNLLDTRIVTLPPIAPDAPPREVALSDYYDFPLPGRSILCALSATF